MPSTAIPRNTSRENIRADPSLLTEDMPIAGNEGIEPEEPGEVESINENLKVVVTEDV